MVGGVGRKEELTETLVTSQRAAECCKELRWLGRELAWLQIPFFFFSSTIGTPLPWPVSLLPALLLVCTPAPCSVSCQTVAVATAVQHVLVTRTEYGAGCS